MNGVMPLFLSVLAGVSFFASVNHFIIGAKAPKENWEHVTFSALCIIFFMLVLSIIWVFRATTTDEYLNSIFYSTIISPFYYLALTWFARVFTETKERRFFWLLIAGHLLFAAKAIVSDYGGLLIKIDGIYLPEQSWIGYHYSPLNPIYSVWALAFLFLLYANLFYIIYCAAIDFRNRRQKGSFFLLINTVFYISLMTLDIYNFSVYNVCTYFAIFCFLPFLLLMSMHMTSERQTKFVSDGEKKYKRLVEGVREDYVVFTYFSNRECGYVSPSVERLLGYKPEEIIGHNWMNIENIANNIQRKFDALIDVSNSKYRSNYRFEFPIRDKNNNEVLFDVAVHLVFDDNNKISLIEAYARDITKQRQYENKLLGFNVELEFLVNQRSTELQSALAELRKEVSEKSALEQQLLQAQKMESIGQLAGGVAHDFNNIMTVISGFSELAINDSRNGKNITDDLEQILEAANRGSRLTEQLLSFARKQVTRPRIVDPNDVIHEAMKFLPRMLSGTTEVIFNPCLNAWPIKIDPIQFEQVIVNLIVNARDAMTGDGFDNEVVIETKNIIYEEARALSNISIPMNDYFFMSVRDTGKGIPPEFHQKIFEPFFTTKAIGKGTGLGLSVCYGVIKQYGGYIFVDSDIDEGATFHIIFPRNVVSDIHSPAVNPQTDFDSEISEGNETLLLVEDDPAVSVLTQKILSVSGYHVLTAINGIEALDVAESYPGKIDLLITDVMMPKMDGKELVDTIRLLSPDIKIICLSGYADSEVIKELRQKGVLFLAKPYSPSQLIMLVQAALKGGTAKNIYEIRSEIPG